MSKVNALYHIVFATRLRENTITMRYKDDLYRYIWSVINAYKCHLLRIGGVENHVHILLRLNPNVALSTLVRDIKSLSSGWLKSESRFPLFNGWCNEYFAETVSPQEAQSVLEYIRNQEKHHMYGTLSTELEGLYKSSGHVYSENELM